MRTIAGFYDELSGFITTGNFLIICLQNKYRLYKELSQPKTVMNIFRSTTDNVVEHRENKEVLDLFSLRNTVTALGPKDAAGGMSSAYEETRTAYLVWKIYRKRLFGRSRPRWGK